MESRTHIDPSEPEVLGSPGGAAQSIYTTAIVRKIKTMKNQNSAAKQPRPTVRVNEAKWSKPLWRAGWIGFPSVFVERQRALGLDPLDLNILLHLADYWWTRDRKPFPSKKTIADAMGVHPRTVQRRIASMEKEGLIRREQRRTYGQGSRGSDTNIYHLDDLIKEATPYAEEKIEQREHQKQKNEARQRYKGKPRPLKLVGGKSAKSRRSSDG